MQEFWNEQTKRTREQRQAQLLRMEEVEKALEPIKSAYEASRDLLSTLQEEDVSIVPAKYMSRKLSRKNPVTERC